MRKSALLAILFNFALIGLARAQTKFPWQFGKEYVINYKQGAVSIGTEKVTFKQVKRDGKDAIESRNVVSLAVGAQTATMRCTFVAALDGQPIEYLNDMEVAGQRVKIHSQFKDGKVSSNVSGAINAVKEESLPAGTFCFENNMLSAAMLAAPQFKLEVGKPYVMRGYYPSVPTLLKLTVEAKALTTIMIEGKSLECYECQITELNVMMWVTKDGRLVKLQQGPMTVEVTSLD